MMVIGGGVIGLELVKTCQFDFLDMLLILSSCFIKIFFLQGSVWGRLGSEVTCVEYMNAIGAGMDPDIS